jgi:hypothetical protein
VSGFALILRRMREGVITVLVRVSRWTEDEMVRVAGAERVATWREADRQPIDGPTEISLDVEASTSREARHLVRAALQEDLRPDAFLASTAQSAR